MSQVAGHITLRLDMDSYVGHSWLSFVVPAEWCQMGCFSRRFIEASKKHRGVQRVSGGLGKPPFGGRAIAGGGGYADPSLALGDPALGTRI